MYKIQLSSKLEGDSGKFHVGPGLWAENDGSLEAGSWDLRTSVADNWLGTDYGEGIVVSDVVLKANTATFKVVISDYDYIEKKSCEFAIEAEIDRRYLVECAA